MEEKGLEVARAAVLVNTTKLQRSQTTTCATGLWSGGSQQGHQGQLIHQVTASTTASPRACGPWSRPLMESTTAGPSAVERTELTIEWATPAVAQVTAAWRTLVSPAANCLRRQMFEKRTGGKEGLDSCEHTMLHHGTKHHQGASRKDRHITVAVRESNTRGKNHRQNTLKLRNRLFISKMAIITCAIIITAFSTSR